MLGYELPMAKVTSDFNDKMKSLTRGYESIEYHVVVYRTNSLASGNKEGITLLKRDIFNSSASEQSSSPKIGCPMYSQRVVKGKCLLYESLHVH